MSESRVRHVIAQAANGGWWVVREIDGVQHRIAGPVRFSQQENNGVEFYDHTHERTT